MRKIINLSGTWAFIPDLDPKYHVAPVYAKPDWDRTNWQKVPVPGVWNHYAERYSIYEGVCWYHREFSVDLPSKGPTCLLKFGAVNYRCEIFINGKKAGEHEGGYTEFVLNVSRLINQGKNHIAVKVDNRAVNMKLPAVLGYFNYGGIHRDVTLEIYTGEYFSDISMDARDDGKLSITGRWAGGKERSVEVEVTCQQITKHCQCDNHSFNVSVKVPDIKAWSPGEPNLYPVTVLLTANGELQDKRVFKVGFRTISLKNNAFALNGKKTFLKGICYLYDSPAYGAVMKKEQFLHDISLLKELGVNIIRSHFPFTDEFLDECDRQGIMVWIEIPVYCLHPPTKERGTVFSDNAVQKLALSMLEEMIVQAKNHPSVVIYGIGNECNTENPEAESFFRQLAVKARELDSTRLLSYAALYCNVGPLAEMVDILGINEYWGWYDIIGQDKPEKLNLKILDDKLTELSGKHKKPMLMTEFGADSIPGYLSESLELWSENYHAELLKKSFEIFKKHPYICGTFPFVFSDYKDPSKHVNKYWNEMNYKGVISYNRRKKLSFFTLQKIYKEILK